MSQQLHHVSSVPFPVVQQDVAKADLMKRLFMFFRPHVKVDHSYLCWEEGEEARSRTVLVQAKPKVKVELLSEEGSRFKAQLSRVSGQNNYQLKVWPRTTRDFAQEAITLLATLPNGQEKLYPVQACVE